MQAILERHISAHRHQLVAAFENWWDKYGVNMSEIEREREIASMTLRRFLTGLRYA